LIIFTLGRKARKVIKEDMDILQREVAVKLARDKLHKDLRDERRNR